MLSKSVTVRSGWFILKMIKPVLKLLVMLDNQSVLLWFVPTLFYNILPSFRQFFFVKIKPFWLIDEKI